MAPAAGPRTRAYRSVRGKLELHPAGNNARICSAGAGQIRTFFNLQVVLAIPFSRWGAHPFITAPLPYPSQYVEDLRFRLGARRKQGSTRRHPIHRALTLPQEIQKRLSTPSGQADNLSSYRVSVAASSLEALKLLGSMRTDYLARWKANSPTPSRNNKHVPGSGIRNAIRKPMLSPSLVGSLPYAVDDERSLASSKNPPPLIM